MQFAFKVLLTGWLASRLDFMWLIGRHRNHRHPVIPHARSSFVVDRNVPRFANFDECFHSSKFLQPLWLILAIKASVSNVIGADLKSCLVTFLIISWKLFLCQLLHFNSLYEQAINWFQTELSSVKKGWLTRLAYTYRCQWTEKQGCSNSAKECKDMPCYTLFPWDFGESSALKFYLKLPIWCRTIVIIFTSLKATFLFHLLLLFLF